MSREINKTGTTESETAMDAMDTTKKRSRSLSLSPQHKGPNDTTNTENADSDKDANDESQEIVTNKKPKRSNRTRSKQSMNQLKGGTRQADQNLEKLVDDAIEAAASQSHEEPLHGDDDQHTGSPEERVQTITTDEQTTKSDVDLQFTVMNITAMTHATQAKQDEHAKELSKLKSAGKTATRELQDLKRESLKQQATLQTILSQLSFIMKFLGVSPTTAAATTPKPSVSDGSGDNPATDSSQSASQGQGQGQAQTTQPAVTRSFKQVIQSAINDDKMQRERRARSVIISGLNSVDNIPDSSVAAQLLKTEFQMDTAITFCRRLGEPTEGRVRPLLVAFNAADDAAWLVSNAKKLRHSQSKSVQQKVFINANLTKEESRRAYERRCSRRNSGNMMQSAKPPPTNNDNNHRQPSRTNNRTAVHHERIIVNSGRAVTSNNSSTTSNLSARPTDNVYVNESTQQLQRPLPASGPEQRASQIIAPASCSMMYNAPSSYQPTTPQLSEPSLTEATDFNSYCSQPASRVYSQQNGGQSTHEAGGAPSHFYPHNQNNMQSTNAPLQLQHAAVPFYPPHYTTLPQVVQHQQQLQLQQQQQQMQQQQQQLQQQQQQQQLPGNFTHDRVHNAPSNTAYSGSCDYRM